MAKIYSPLNTTALHDNTHYAHPPTPPAVMYIDEPALDAMINFKERSAITIHPDAPLNEALIEMKACGVHLLLVIDVDEKVLGVITSETILGSKPMTIMTEKRIQREALTVRMLMTPNHAITAFDEAELAFAKIGHIVMTLQAHKQHHALVVKQQTDNSQLVIGMFSAHTLSKQLGQDVTKDVSAAQSLAELTQTREEH